MGPYFNHLLIDPLRFLQWTEVFDPKSWYIFLHNTLHFFGNKERKIRLCSPFLCNSIAREGCRFSSKTKAFPMQFSLFSSHFFTSFEKKKFRVLGIRRNPTKLLTKIIKKIWKRNKGKTKRIKSIKKRQGLDLF